MRYESTVTSLSWIPSEAVTGGTRAAFEGGFTHYDDPPPGELASSGDQSVAALRAVDRFRFANVLRAWIETDDAGRIAGAGYAADSGGLMGSTTVNLGLLHHTFQAIQLCDLRQEPEYGDGWVRFTQTTGGRTGLPAPRRVTHPPYVQWQAPTVWTTLTLTLRADGTAEIGVPGASQFPRHWVYDGSGRLARKSGLTKPRIASYAAGSVLVTQGQPGTEVYLILDGVLRVERDGVALAEYGPGAMLGERSGLEDGNRTASLVAVTSCKVAAVDGACFDRAALSELSTGHRREDAGAIGEA